MAERAQPAERRRERSPEPKRSRARAFMRRTQGLRLTEMAPRSLWSGSISFGLVNAPVRIYALLARAMDESGLAAVAKFVMRDQQHVGVLRVREGMITLEQLYFADEIRPIDEIKPGSAGRINKEQLEMAARLIESYRAD